MSLPSPAATVAIISDSDNGIKVLMVKRNQNLANAGGAWAFPGGRVEDEDYADTDDHFLAAQCAAVRETIEETGLIVNQKSLVPFAHWTTPPGPRKRFATWFFLTEISVPARVQVDGEEIVDHCWLTPEQVLQQQRQGQMVITPPGFVTLTRLLDFTSAAAAVSAYAEADIAHYNPKLLETDSGRVIFYEGDAGYNNRDLTAHGERNRIVIEGNHWHYDSTL